MAIQPYQEDSNVSTPVKRIRWATQRVASLSGHNKRRGIASRFQKRAGAGENKRESAGTDSLGELPAGSQPQDDRTSNEGGENNESNRRIFFNKPLPKDATDDDGHNLANFGRNKIRTAKYTPLTFVPKNLWYQFHNIANIYFFFLIILAVFYPFLSISRYLY